MGESLVAAVDLAFEENDRMRNCKVNVGCDL
jgi:hypothetical protein